MPLIPFATGHHRGRSLAVNTERLVNLFPELAGAPGRKTAVALYGTPGSTLWADFGSFPVRGWQVAATTLYAVLRDRVLKIANDATATDLGAIDTNSGVVSMARNRANEIMLVDRVDGWIINTSTDALTKITDASFTAIAGPRHVTELDNFFAVQFFDTDQWNLSAAGDGFTWSALDFTTANKRPDPLVNLRASQGYLWALGSESTEVFYNAGTYPFPMQRLGGVTIEWGLAAIESVAPLGPELAFLAFRHTDGAVRALMTQGATVQPISGNDQESIWNSYATVADAVAWTHAVDSHAFYVVSFPTADATWCYDLSTGIWHRRQYGLSGRVRGALHAMLGGKSLVADHSNGKIYQLSPTAYDDAGEDLHAIAETAMLTDAETLLRHRALQIVFEPGVGLQTGDGSDPEALLRVSNDGGRTFGAELRRSIGKVGEYERRAIWRQLGQARNRVYRLEITDPVKRVIVGMVPDVVR